MSSALVVLQKGWLERYSRVLDRQGPVLNKFRSVLVEKEEAWNHITVNGLWRRWTRDVKIREMSWRAGRVNSNCPKLSSNPTTAFLFVFSSLLFITIYSLYLINRTYFSQFIKKWNGMIEANQKQAIFLLLSFLYVQEYLWYYYC